MNGEEREKLRASLVRTSDIARRLGVAKPNVANWKVRYPDFPEPILADKSGYNGVYWWPDIEDFLRRHELPSRNREHCNGKINRVTGMIEHARPCTAHG